ncbi:MAG TPA: fumarylacetoacetate hydrolase family protein [Polyangiales bacterium]|jgi:2-keto-4-pentenoate hydratase/2-oxohepta-3-ene-1,7-dioic acid hydratase in catechol pathway|nr:fumarylacetoacetate hydrolase family protein [Polyangiales bacterium]
MSALKLCNYEGRASLDRDGRVIDVERRSGGTFSADPMAALARWDEFQSWADAQQAQDRDPQLDPARLGPCVPRPGQLFAIGLNYRDHAKEANLQIPEQPMVFTKFQGCLGGARASIELLSDTVDYEVELVVVIGKTAHRVSAANALEHVAGYCIGQDISDRRLQFASVPPQFSLAKSSPNFGPIGPALVARKDVPSTALALHCDVNGERRQNGSTADMIFPVPVLIEYLSRRCVLSPGDILFTGTPSGVGSVRNPKVYLKPGDVIRSEITGLGVLENRCV